MAITLPKIGHDDPLKRHLSAHYARMLDVLMDYRQTGDSESLHNARISIRRFRAQLRLFRKPLQTTSAEKVSSSLGSLLKLLGTARDTDVWIKSLERLEKELKLSNEASWHAFMSDQRLACQSTHRKTREKLRSKRALIVLDQVKALVTSEVGGKVAGGTQGFTDFLAVKIYKSVRRHLKPQVSLDEFTEVQLHRFRRKCRLIRYWTEWARPYLGKSGIPFLKSFQRFSVVLGKARDAAATEQKLLGITSPWGPKVRKWPARRRKRALQDFHKEWDACAKKRARLDKLYRQALKRSKKTAQAMTPDTTA